MLFRVTTHAERANCQEFFWKKVRAKVRIRSHFRTSSFVREKVGRAEGAQYGESMDSALRARANSEGGRKARNEILIVSFFESKNYL